MPYREPEPQAASTAQPVRMERTQTEMEGFWRLRIEGLSPPQVVARSDPEKQGYRLDPASVTGPPMFMRLYRHQQNGNTIRIFQVGKTTEVITNDTAYLDSLERKPPGSR